MAKDEAGLGKTPEILGKRQATVELSDGTTVIVYKWGRDKFATLLPLVGNLKDSPTIAEQSVAEADREKVRALDPLDLLAISVAASKLNVTEAVLKNLSELLSQSRGLTEALKDPSPSNPK